MSPPGHWTILTGHGHVLVEIARDPKARIRDIAAAAGITERAVQAIVADLEAAGYITRARAGRRTVYTVNTDRPFRHSAQDGHLIGPLLDLLAATGNETLATPRPDASPAAEPDPPGEPWGHADASGSATAEASRVAVSPTCCPPDG